MNKWVKEDNDDEGEEMKTKNPTTLQHLDRETTSFAVAATSCKQKHRDVYGDER